MAKENSKSNIATVGLIVVAFLVLAGIIYYSFNTKPDNSTSKSSGTTNTTSTDATATVDQLGPREVKLTPDNFDATVAKAGVVLVDVYSPTCPHCQKVAPILTGLSNDYGDKLTVAKMSVAVDANRDFILKKFTDFQYVPAIWIYKDGKQVESFTGERTKDEFKQLIDKYLN